MVRAGLTVYEDSRETFLLYTGVIMTKFNFYSSEKLLPMTGLTARFNHQVHSQDKAVSPRDITGVTFNQHLIDDTVDEVQGLLYGMLSLLIFLFAILNFGRIRKIVLTGHHFTAHQLQQNEKL